ncbi:hypothetical protein MN608_09804 [Microdochium nivale]|nr:hypothetical protein MN608_09804 [Microdochium nivale]
MGRHDNTTRHGTTHGQSARQCRELSQRPMPHDGQAGRRARRERELSIEEKKERKNIIEAPDHQRNTVSLHASLCFRHARLHCIAVVVVGVSHKQQGSLACKSSELQIIALIMGGG